MIGHCYAHRNFSRTFLVFFLNGENDVMSFFQRPNKSSIDQEDVRFCKLVFKRVLFEKYGTANNETTYSIVSETCSSFSWNKPVVELKARSTSNKGRRGVKRRLWWIKGVSTPKLLSSGVLWPVGIFDPMRNKKPSKNCFIVSKDWRNKRG